ncbi:MAG: orotidine-5'-phosphate decarboxylase, partial [Deinococcus sp.]|nr:orotidine-5'-phosphate decarboxylase [Deinococcus sp.]
MTLPFAQAVTERTRTLGTRLCVGLDPRLGEYRGAEHLRQHTLDVLEATAPYAAAVKPQLAFYEALGLSGMQILEEVCAAARTLGLPVILDAKRGDIGSTAEAYAQGWLTGQHAGAALTVNP